MKILMYSILDTERPYVEAWVNKTGHQVKMGYVRIIGVNSK